MRSNVDGWNTSSTASRRFAKAFAYADMDILGTAVTGFSGRADA